MEEPIVCPYCRMPFDDQGPPKIYCTSCGMPHHEDCYQDNGGCTVFGCPRAPADDPKVHVSYSDLQMSPVIASPQPQVREPVSPLPAIYSRPLGLNLATGSLGAATAAVAAPAPSRSLEAAAVSAPQQVSTPRRQPKSRTTFIMLGILLGGLGAHNFYAGYTGRAVGQLCLSVLTLFYLAVVSWIWAIVEICVVDKDSAGIQFS
jgi:TM2 domain-containing membrane protein YozV